jgi:hypothetical protein
MHCHLTHSLVPRAIANEPEHDDMQPGRGVIAEPTHDQIAERANEIYVKAGCKQGCCEQHWQQAEAELRSRSPIISLIRERMPLA